MKIKVSDLKLDENAIYEATITDIKINDGNFGPYFIISLNTPHGNPNLLINLSAKGKLNRFLYACGVDITSMKDDDEIDFAQLVGKKIGVKLSYSTEGYLRVVSLHRIGEEVEFFEENPEELFK